MCRPKVSIIVPAYNAETHIEKAIHSALGQTINDLEVVVVDDGSIDKTAEIVRQFQDPRVRFISQKNQGQSVAINKGVEYAMGAYIKLLDADDWLNPTHVESQLKAINNKPGTLASCKWGYFVKDYKNPTVREEVTNKNYGQPLEWLVDSLTKDEGMMGGWMWLIPRSLWEKAGGFDSRLSLNNDFHFSIKLLLGSEGIQFAKDAVYGYRKGIAGALSGSSGRTAMESAFLTTELGTKLLLECEYSPRIEKICADRFQQWLFQFHPQHSDLVRKTEKRIEELGGSDLDIQGGTVLRVLTILLGWKGARRLQSFVYQHGYQKILQKKAKIRLRKID